MSRRINLDMAAKIWTSALPRGINKLVFQCYAHHLNSKEGTRYFGLSWPSISRVALMCGMSERTVQIHLRALQAAGLLRPRLRTGRTTLYSIHLDSLVPLVFATDTVELDAGGNPVDNSALSCSDDAVSAETLQESAPESEENDIKPVEICTLTPNTTPKNELGTAETAAPALPVLMVIDGVSPQVLADFAAIRKTKRKGAVTATLIEEICAQAAIAGLTLEQVLKICTTRNWARFEASWLADTGRTGTSTSNAATTVPAPPAGPPPEPAKPASAEVVAAGRQRLQEIRKIMHGAPALPAMPTGASEIRIAPDAPSWAVSLVNKQRTGQHVNRAALDNACAVLKLDPASLRRASAAAACMH